MVSKTKLQKWRGVTNCMEHTMAIGAAVAANVKPGDLIALNGELGAGKTQLVRGLAQGMNLDTQLVASPTFVLIHEYEPEAEDSDSPALIHIDAYRLTSLEDLESIGWEVDAAGGIEMRQGCVVVIEWAQKVQEFLGEDYLEVTLEHLDDEQRAIEITPHGKWAKRFKALTKSLDKVAPVEAKPLPVVEKHLCPICGKVVRDDDSAIFPFCSDRCRTIDLGKWLGGDYVISRPIDQSDLDEV